ncbi:hypothetical protein GCM10009775_29590 [Microbacterium aoyamense]|uniref:Uncharacterized protein n=1 Tax=Microbacterium aoyamense TaxID=344166 RepID=A0ABN2PWR2_9MICO|nr:hypothetical protein [Microbacterium aoyamense]
MSMPQFLAEFVMGIGGAHPEPRSVILAMLAEDARPAETDDPVSPRSGR